MGSWGVRIGVRRVGLGPPSILHYRHRNFGTIWVPASTPAFPSSTRHPAKPINEFAPRSRLSARWFNYFSSCANTSLGCHSLMVDKAQVRSGEEVMSGLNPVKTMRVHKKEVRLD